MTEKEKQYLEQELDKLLSMEAVQAMDEFIQHGNISCLASNIQVLPLTMPKRILNYPL